MVFGDPPLTPMEERELADIPPYARAAFYRAVRFHWYATAAVGTFVGWTIEYTALSVDFGWLYTIPMLVMALVVHRMKWNRSTDYGALSKAKLAMRPDWPSWKRERDFYAELRDIRERNPARDGAEMDEFDRDDCHLGDDCPVHRQRRREPEEVSRCL